MTEKEYSVKVEKKVTGTVEASRPGWWTVEVGGVAYAVSTEQASSAQKALEFVAENYLR